MTDPDLKQNILEIHKNEQYSEDEKSKLIFSILNKNVSSSLPRGVLSSFNAQKCPNYDRNCCIKAECCGRVYCCKYCHNEAADHEINVYKDIREIKCTKCETFQVVSNECKSCGVKFGEYYCSICKLWENKKTTIYHCNECNICRCGLRKDFFHCKNCSCCLNKSIQDTHVCIPDIFKSNCPICCEFMFTSKTDVITLKCGHMIHFKCLENSLKSHEYRCPICKKSTIDMENVWNATRNMCNANNVPDEYKNWTTNIYCNDCDKNSVIKYHIIALECEHCKGFNTALQDLYKNNTSDTDSTSDADSEPEPEPEPESDIINHFDNHIAETIETIENYDTESSSSSVYDISDIEQEFDEQFKELFSSMSSNDSE